jgi:hypothetical protein
MHEDFSPAPTTAVIGWPGWLVIVIKPLVYANLVNQFFPALLTMLVPDRFR